MFSELVESTSFRVARNGVLWLTIATISGQTWACGQGAVAPENERAQSLPQVESNGAGSAKTYTMRVATHEVIVDVVALGAHDQPVSDMKKDEFRVLEVGKEPKRLPHRIAAFRAVDPTSDEESGSTMSGGFRVSAHAGCAMRFTRHYRIAFNPSSQGWAGGKHEVVVMTSRAHVTLAYNPEYYVGIVSPPAKPKLRNDKAAADMLAQVACGGRAAVPASIGLNMHLIRTKESDPLRISVVVQSDSLPFLSLANGVRQIALDYGACTFNAEGKALAFMNRPVERVLSAEDYSEAMASGFPNVIELPRTAGGAMVRFVVLDRATGNLGFADVVTTEPPRNAGGSTARNAREKQAAMAAQDMDKTDIARMLGGETAGTFGSIVPDSNAMCGDVYELSEQKTKGIPNYWDHLETGEPVGAIYADSLKVPYEMPVGITSVTSQTEWFGIDYHGKFWIQTPGTYRFRLYSDNGAELWIDDHVVVRFDGDDQWKHAQKPVELSAGIHTLHVPYYQGAGHVGLVLLVQAPGGAERVFHMRDFSPPTGQDVHADLGARPN